MADPPGACFYDNSTMYSFRNCSADFCLSLPSPDQQVNCSAQNLNIFEPPSIYDFTSYTSLWEPVTCYLFNVTYDSRQNLAESFNFCSVPLMGQDAFLFVSISLLAASILFGKLSAVWVLIVGGVLGLVNYYANLLEISNAIALWVGISPPDLFFYAFLPPLILDSAIRMDMFMFRKLFIHIFLMAFVMVIMSACLMSPIILFVMGFQHRGWSWVQGALFAAMVASTDALAVAAILRTGGGPPKLVTLSEGESLLNDASAITLFEVFMGILERAGGPSDPVPSVASVLPTILKEIVRLSAIGLGLGLGFSIVTTYLLRWLRWRGAKSYIENTVVLAMAYLSFYVTNAPAKGSGVIAVVVFGLYGNSTSKWGMLASAEESGAFFTVWDSISFAANGIVFFWSGVACINYFLRSVYSLGFTAWSYGAIPLIFIFMLLVRGLCIASFNPIFKLLGEPLNLREIGFLTWSGLRGSVSLIMIADFVTKNSFTGGDGDLSNPATVQDIVNSDIALWTSAYVLLTLCVNAPTISTIMDLLRLNKIPTEKMKMRSKAKRALLRFTAAAISSLKEDDAEFLQGANWDAVSQYVDMTSKLSRFDPPPNGYLPPDDPPGQFLQRTFAWARASPWFRRCCCCCFWRRQGGEGEGGAGEARANGGDEGAGGEEAGWKLRQQKFQKEGTTRKAGGWWTFRGGEGKGVEGMSTKASLEDNGSAGSDFGGDLSRLPSARSSSFGRSDADSEAGSSIALSPAASDETFTIKRRLSRMGSTLHRRTSLPELEECSLLLEKGGGGTPGPPQPKGEGETISGDVEMGLPSWDAAAGTAGGPPPTRTASLGSLARITEGRQLAMGLGEEGGQVQKGDLSPTHQPPPPGSRPEARSWAAVVGGQASREEGGGQHLGGDETPDYYSSMPAAAGRQLAAEVMSKLRGEGASQREVASPSVPGAGVEDGGGGGGVESDSGGYYSSMPAAVGRSMRDVLQQELAQARELAQEGAGGGEAQYRGGGITPPPSLTSPPLPASGAAPSTAGAGAEEEEGEVLYYSSMPAAVGEQVARQLASARAQQQGDEVAVTPGGEKAHESYAAPPQPPSEHEVQQQYYNSLPADSGRQLRAKLHAELAQQGAAGAAPLTAPRAQQRARSPLGPGGGLLPLAANEPLEGEGRGRADEGEGDGSVLAAELSTLSVPAGAGRQLQQQLHAKLAAAASRRESQSGAGPEGSASESDSGSHRLRPHRPPKPKPRHRPASGATPQHAQQEAQPQQGPVLVDQRVEAREPSHAPSEPDLPVEYSEHLPARARQSLQAALKAKLQQQRGGGGADDGAAAAGSSASPLRSPSSLGIVFEPLPDTAPPHTHTLASTPAAAPGGAAAVELGARTRAAPWQHAKQPRAPSPPKRRQRTPSGAYATLSGATGATLAQELRSQLRAGGAEKAPALSAPSVPPSTAQRDLLGRKLVRPKSFGDVLRGSKGKGSDPPVTATATANPSSAEAAAPQSAAPHLPANKHVLRTARTMHSRQSSGSEHAFQATIMRAATPVADALNRSRSHYHARAGERGGAHSMGSGAEGAGQRGGLVMGVDPFKSFGPVVKEVEGRSRLGASDKGWRHRRSLNRSATAASFPATAASGPGKASPRIGMRSSQAALLSSVFTPSPPPYGPPTLEHVSPLAGSKGGSQVGEGSTHGAAAAAFLKAYGGQGGGSADGGSASGPDPQSLFFTSGALGEGVMLTAGPQEIAEMRSRLVAGLRRYFLSKRMQGLLSAQGMRILEYACEVASERCDQPLTLWTTLEEEVKGGWWTRLAARSLHSTLSLLLRMPSWALRVLGWPMKKLGDLLRLLLGRAMLVACEVSVEYYLSLMHSPQIQWLKSTDEAWPLQAEVEAEIDSAYKFIIDREIEAPDRFQAIQSYRAAMALTRQQINFVQELFDTGMIDAGESEYMNDPLDKNMRQLEIVGPVWRPSRPKSVLRSLPFISQIPEPLFQSVYREGEIRMVRSGEVLWASSDVVRESGGKEGPGIFIVLAGVIKRVFTHADGTKKEYCQGTGGTVGVLLAMTGSRLPGSEVALAQGNSLGRGPMVFHIPQSFCFRLHLLAESGVEGSELLHTQLLRLSALYVLECLDTQLVAQMEGHLVALAMLRAGQAMKRPPGAAAPLGPRHRRQQYLERRSLPPPRLSRPSVGVGLARKSVAWGAAEAAGGGGRGTEEGEGAGVIPLVPHGIGARGKQLSSLMQAIAQLEFEEMEGEGGGAGDSDSPLARQAQRGGGMEGDVLEVDTSDEEEAGGGGDGGEANGGAGLHPAPSWENGGWETDQAQRYMRHKARTAARRAPMYAAEVLDEMRRGVPFSEVCELPAGAYWRQVSHAVLVLGSLSETPPDWAMDTLAASAADLGGQNGRQPPQQLSAPHIIGWLWSPSLRCSRRRRGCAPPYRGWVAGPEGATVVVCLPEDGSELPPLQVPVTLAGRPTQRSSDSFYGEEGEGQASGSANTLSQEWCVGEGGSHQEAGEGGAGGRDSATVEQARHMQQQAAESDWVEEENGDGGGGRGQGRRVSWVVDTL